MSPKILLLVYLKRFNKPFKIEYLLFVHKKCICLVIKIDINTFLVIIFCNSEFKSEINNVNNVNNDKNNK